MKHDCSIESTNEKNFRGAMLVPILITKDKNYTSLIEAVSQAGPQVIAVSSPAIHRGIARGTQSFSRSLHHGCQEEGCKEEGRAEEEGREEEVVFAPKHRGEPAKAGSPLFFLPQGKSPVQKRARPVSGRALGAIESKSGG